MTERRKWLWSEWFHNNNDNDNDNGNIEKERRRAGGDSGVKTTMTTATSIWESVLVLKKGVKVGIVITCDDDGSCEEEKVVVVSLSLDGGI